MKKSQIATWIVLLSSLTACAVSAPLSTTAWVESKSQIQALSLGLRPQSFANGKSLSIRQEGQVLITNVPYAHQGKDNTCGQAVMAMLLKYWGSEIDYLKVAKEGNPLNLATSQDSILSYLNQKGLRVKAHKGDIPLLLAELHQARPVIALLDFGGLGKEHYVLVVGYNPVSAEILIHDSITNAYKPIALNQFLKSWQNQPVVDLPIWGGPQYKNLMFSVQLPEQKS